MLPHINNWLSIVLLALFGATAFFVAATSAINILFERQESSTSSKEAIKIEHHEKSQTQLNNSIETIDSRSSRPILNIFSIGEFLTLLLIIAAFAQASTSNSTLEHMRSESEQRSAEFKAQLAALEANNKAAERSSFASRAWLGIRFLEVSDPVHQGERGAPKLNRAHVKFEIANFGLTPARILKINSTLYIEERDYSIGDGGLEELTLIDPDNNEHLIFGSSSLRILNDADSGEVIFDRSYNPIYGEFPAGRDNQEIVLSGNGDAKNFDAQFVFELPQFSYDSSDWRNQGRVRYNWWHIEIEYVDVFRERRHTCYFARIGKNSAYIADHLQTDKHNRWD